MGRLTEQYRGVLAADGAGAELASLVKDAQEDIAQIEEQLTSLYIDAKASRISEALDECATPLCPHRLQPSFDQQHCAVVRLYGGIKHPEDVSRGSLIHEGSSLNMT